MNNNGNQNIYQPKLIRVIDKIQETPDVFTFKWRFVDEKENESFDFKVGQFGEFTVFGEGESTFDICNSPTQKEYNEFCCRVVGKVTKALSKVEPGETLGFRGPYGGSFPVDKYKGSNMLFISGGIALPPVRCVIDYCLAKRSDYADLTILYGARTVDDLVYKYMLKDWGNRTDVKLVTTVDPGGETPDWKGDVGFVPSVLEKMNPSRENTYVVLIGPPIMIKISMQVLGKLGFDPGRIYTSLENKMKCGVGKCGRCNVGNVYVCKDGPVFTYSEILALPQEDI
jgi:NAD(P)H-flavin reductase